MLPLLSFSGFLSLNLNCFPQIWCLCFNLKKDGVGWVAQLVESPTLSFDSGHDSRDARSSPACWARPWGWSLRVKPLNILFPSPSVPCPPRLRICALSQSKIIKIQVWEPCVYYLDFNAACATLVIIQFLRLINQ